MSQFGHHGNPWPNRRYGSPNVSHVAHIVGDQLCTFRLLKGAPLRSFPRTQHGETIFSLATDANRPEMSHSQNPVVKWSTQNHVKNYDGIPQLVLARDYPQLTEPSTRIGFEQVAHLFFTFSKDHPRSAAKNKGDMCLLYGQRRRNPRVLSKWLNLSFIFLPGGFKAGRRDLWVPRPQANGSGYHAKPIGFPKSTRRKKGKKLVFGGYGGLPCT